MPVASRPLGQYLVGQGIISSEQLDWALARETEGTPLPAILVRHELATEKQVLAAAADQMGLPFVDFRRDPPQPSMARWLPPAIARRVGAVPVGLQGEALVVAVPDPTDQRVVDWLASQSGRAVVAALASQAELEEAHDALYGRAEAAPAEKADAGAIDVLLTRVVELGGSDLHLSAGLAPGIRIHGEITPLAGFAPLDAQGIERMVFSILNDKQRATFATDRELDTSHTIPGVGRFRVNVFLQRNAVGAVMRVIPFEIPEFASLGLPPSVASVASLPRGLVLVTGPTGSGKSTTLASLIDIINSTRAGHIMTIEDPIEFLHTHKRSIVNQREVGEDTQSFASALKHVLRQDPDVILVGEMRDLETMATALTAAETGHLVFGTLHTQSAPQSVDRVIDVFPAHQQQQVRTQLSTALQAVVTQQLVPIAGGGGRVVAAEVLIVTSAVRNLIREGKTHQVPSTMQSGGKFGMQTMDQSLAALVKVGTITMDTALERCHNPEDLRRLAVGS